MTTSFPSGAGTGIGSLPGTDIAEAIRTVFGELPDLPHLPELPARGPGADMIGRAAGFLVDLPTEVYAGRWRVASRPGRDARRTADLLERDLDELTEQTQGYTGPLKVQAAGPWSLAASVDRPIGGLLLRDPGAVRDLTGSLAEGLRQHVREVARRVPGAQLILQLDEPTLPAVLAGHIRTESGLSTLRVIPGPDAATALREVIDVVGVPVVLHCCAQDAPIELFHSAGAAAIAVDLSLVTDLDAIGEAVDSGVRLFAGAVPSTGPVPTAAQVAATIRELWHKLGFPFADLPDKVVVTPACGLAGASPETARAVLTTTREAAKRLFDEARS